MSDKLITDVNELGSFLVPAYGFQSMLDAGYYLHGAYEGSITTPQEVTNTHIQPATFVMIPGWWMDQTGTTLLTDYPESRRGQNGPPQAWHRLREASKQKPDNARSFGLMIEGRRQYYRHTRSNAHTSRRVESLNSGPRDCYAAWSRYNGDALPIAFETVDDQGRAKRIRYGNSGRGAIFTATTVYDVKGKPKGTETRLVLIELSILDKDSSRDEMMRLTWHAMPHTFGDETRPTQFDEPDLSYYKLDEVWTALAHRAYEGFVHTCKTQNAEVENDRRFMIRQIDLRVADEQKPYGERFENRIREMDWQEALRNSREPWQLEMVVHHFSGQKQFMEVPGNYSGTRGQHVANMLKAHTCDDVRREQLNRWIRDFVAPRDNLWNYSGD